MPSPCDSFKVSVSKGREIEHGVGDGKAFRLQLLGGKSPIDPKVCLRLRKRRHPFPSPTPC